MTEYIDVHTHKFSTKETGVFSLLNYQLPINEAPDDNRFSAGWHPWDIGNIPIEEIENSLDQVLSSKNLLAIGECGLDRAIPTSIDWQIEVFMLHLQKAVLHSKPLIVHCVRAYSDLLHIFKKTKSLPKMIIHGFNGNSFEAGKLIRHNCYLSFGKSILSGKSKMVEVLPTIPIENLFFETDDDDISIIDVYFRASEILNIKLADLILQVKKNFNELTGYGLA
ncbi:MAG: TatD family hydrolase [Prolixibacteraceae bacterium]|nr:TatD family hydrolase [Prolixibacteraceae bacterium]